MRWALNTHTCNMHYIWGLCVQLKYAHQMSFIGYLNLNDWKSDWTNNDACNFTWSHDQTHVSNQSSRLCLNKWNWGGEEQEFLERLTDLLCTDNVLAHYNPFLGLGIPCDASEVGIGAVLFHRYPDGSERPVANVSKTLSDMQCRYMYSQIHKEALPVGFAL